MVDMYRGPEAARQPAVYRVAPTPHTPDDLLALRGWEPAMRVTWGPTGYATTFQALWTPHGLCVRWDCQDQAPWATCTERDDALWDTEVVEVFIDPTCAGQDYAELEISPANVVCDLHVERLSPARIMHLDWNFAGLRTAVHRHGDDWTAVAWLPFAGFATLSPAVSACVPPKGGDVWHVNAFRIKRPGGPHDPERGAIYAAWSVPDGPTFHAPDFFRPLCFDPAVGDSATLP